MIFVQLNVCSMMVNNFLLISLASGSVWIKRELPHRFLVIGDLCKGLCKGLLLGSLGLACLPYCWWSLQRPTLGGSLGTWLAFLIVGDHCKGLLLVAAWACLPYCCWWSLQRPTLGGSLGTWLAYLIVDLCKGLLLVATWALGLPTLIVGEHCKGLLLLALGFSWSHVLSLNKMS